VFSYLYGIIGGNFILYPNQHIAENINGNLDFEILFKNPSVEKTYKQGIPEG